MATPLATELDWETANNEFLAASLDWLRLLLRKALPSESVTARQITAAARAVDRAELAGPVPALVGLAQRLGLSRFERDTLLLCAATEFDPGIAELCAAVQGIAYPTFGLALRVLPDPAWEVVSPRGGLRHWRLVELSTVPGQALVAGALRVDERIVHYLKGLNYLDDRLDRLVTPLPLDPELSLPPSQQDAVDQVVAGVRRGPVQLAGADRASKELVAAEAAARVGLLGYRLPAALLPAGLVEVDALARLWEREAALLPLALYLDADEDDGDSSIARFLDRVHGPALFAARESRPDLGTRVVDIEPPTPAERATAWQARLGPELPADLLSAQFGLDVGGIRDIARDATDLDQVWRACRLRARPRLETLAQRLTPKVRLDDLVLPEPGRALLREIVDQVAQRTTVYERWGFGHRISRGLGVSALFAGPSGTGKTMAAEVLANELNLDLYRIDLSSVVSKYIGETEKNLRTLFDAADTGGAILFFDECDALFGKRSEVKDAHDRYANIQVNYLLQRVEAFRGLAILATNMRNALDKAFLRRLRFIVEFPFPDATQRAEIWRRAFPSTAPVAELDFDRLARLAVSGGVARNIALNAAFRAASAGTEITMAVVLAAARVEFDKLELPVRERDFLEIGHSLEVGHSLEIGHSLETGHSSAD
ncbi:MAG TPA: ATP-binding protein [Pseudonocardiaceae bacterium]